MKAKATNVVLLSIVVAVGMLWTSRALADDQALIGKIFADIRNQQACQYVENGIQRQCYEVVVGSYRYKGKYGATSNQEDSFQMAREVTGNTYNVFAKLTDMMQKRHTFWRGFDGNTIIQKVQIPGDATRYRLLSGSADQALGGTNVPALGLTFQFEVQETYDWTVRNKTDNRVVLFGTRKASIRSIYPDALTLQVEQQGGVYLTRELILQRSGSVTSVLEFQEYKRIDVLGIWRPYRMSIRYSSEGELLEDAVTIGTWYFQKVNPNFSTRGILIPSSNELVDISQPVSPVNVTAVAPANDPGLLKTAYK